MTKPTLVALCLSFAEQRERVQLMANAHQKMKRKNRKRREERKLDPESRRVRNVRQRRVRNEHDLYASLFRGGRRRYLSDRGKLVLALRRTAGNIAASKLGVTLQLDVGRRQVTMGEITLRASLVAAARRFHAEHRS